MYVQFKQIKRKRQQQSRSNTDNVKLVKKTEADVHRIKLRASFTYK